MSTPPSAVVEVLDRVTDLGEAALTQVRFWTSRAHAILWTGLPVLIITILVAALISTFGMGGELVAQIILVIAAGVVGFIFTHPIWFAGLTVGGIAVGLADANKQAFDVFSRGIENLFARILPLVLGYILGLAAAAILVLDPAEQPGLAVLLLTSSIFLAIFTLALKKEGKFALKIGFGIYVGAVAYCTAVLITGGDPFRDTIALHALAVGIGAGIIGFFGVSAIQGSFKQTWELVWKVVRKTFWVALGVVIFLVILWNNPGCTGWFSETAQVWHEAWRAKDHTRAEEKRQEFRAKGLDIPDAKTEQAQGGTQAPTIIVPPAAKPIDFTAIDTTKWPRDGKEVELPIVPGRSMEVCGFTPGQRVKVLPPTSDPKTGWYFLTNGIEWRTFPMARRSNALADASFPVSGADVAGIPLVNGKPYDDPEVSAKKNKCLTLSLNHSSELVNGWMVVREHQGVKYHSTIPLKIVPAP